MKILGQIGNYTIIDRESEFQSFVCAFLYNSADGSWANGHYFHSFEQCVKFALFNGRCPLEMDRLIEIASCALSFLRWDMDENYIPDMDENYSLELDTSERAYFGIEYMDEDY